MKVPAGPHTLHETTPANTFVTFPFTDAGFFMWGKQWTWNAANDHYEAGDDWLVFSDQPGSTPPWKLFAGQYNGGVVGGEWK